MFQVTSSRGQQLTAQLEAVAGEFAALVDSLSPTEWATPGRNSPNWQLGEDEHCPWLVRGAGPTHHRRRSWTVGGGQLARRQASPSSSQSVAQRASRPAKSILRTDAVAPPPPTFAAPYCQLMEDTMGRTDRRLFMVVLSLALATTITTVVPIAASAQATTTADQTGQQQALYQSELEQNLLLRNKLGYGLLAAYGPLRTPPA